MIIFVDLFGKTIKYQRMTTKQTKKATLGELNESNVLFFQADWEIDGAAITAIHGIDKSTQAAHDAAPKGYVMVTTTKQRNAMLSPETVCEA